MIHRGAKDPYIDVEKFWALETDENEGVDHMDNEKKKIKARLAKAKEEFKNIV